jgi:hypothetical protein
MPPGRLGCERRDVVQPLPSSPGSARWRQRGEALMMLDVQVKGLPSVGGSPAELLDDVERDEVRLERLRRMVDRCRAAHAPTVGLLHLLE